MGGVRARGSKASAKVGLMLRLSNDGQPSPLGTPPLVIREFFNAYVSISTVTGERESGPKGRMQCSKQVWLGEVSQ